MTTETAAAHSAPLNVEACLTRSIEASTGIILVEGRGMWSDECAASHFAELSVLIDATRRQRGAVKVLIDLGAALVQASSTSTYIEKQAQSLYREHDRVAIVVSSRLLAMQMRRVGGRASYRHFDSRSDAHVWLSADPS